jgi:hypothetical protein
MKKILSSLLACVLCLSLVACSVDQVLTDVGVAIQIAASIGAAVGPISAVDAAEVAKLSAIATQGLNAVKAAYDAYKASGATTDLAKLQAAVDAVQANLPAELAAAHISDPNAMSKVTAWVGLVVTSVAAIAAAIPQLTSPVVAASKKAKLMASLPSAKTLQARWASEVCKGDVKCSALVKVNKHGLFVHVLTFNQVK